MKIKTATLTGLALDWAVWEAKRKNDGLDFVLTQYGKGLWYGGDNDRTYEWHPHENWLQGGTIIEREWLQLIPWPNESDENLRWNCVQHDVPVQCHAFGPTPLIAAMRCYVASCLGDEVDIPEELLK